MPAEKKDRRIAADNASADSPEIFFLPRCPPDRSPAADQPSELFPTQNLAARLRACNPARTSEFAIRPACCSSSPIRKPAAHSREAASARAAAAPLATSDGYKAAGPAEIEPGPRSPAKYCPP